MLVLSLLLLPALLLPALVGLERVERWVLDSPARPDARSVEDPPDPAESPATRL